MFNFDADAARDCCRGNCRRSPKRRCEKFIPNHLYVAVKERSPVARWRVDGTTYVIDGMGAKIADDGNDYPALPLVIGTPLATMPS